MLRRNKEAKQRWAGLNTALDRWLDERQDLLVRYFKLAGLPPYDEHPEQLPSAEDIRGFCEVLVDYISAGHFELYDHILAEAQAHNQRTDALAKQLYPLIAITTEAALRFNDEYAEACDEDSLPHFTRDLSTLGEALQNRLEYEDQLIALLAEHEVLPQA